jgi:hypothetical protein
VADPRQFEESPGLEAVGNQADLRTGVRPTFGMDGFWAITVPATEEMLAMTDDEKAAFLEAHETRPLTPGQWECRAPADDGRKDGA